MSYIYGKGSGLELIFNNRVAFGASLAVVKKRHSAKLAKDFFFSVHFCSVPDLFREITRNMHFYSINTTTLRSLARVNKTNSSEKKGFLIDACSSTIVV